MKNKRTKLITIIALFCIFSGVISIISSIPIFAMITSIQRGGLATKNGTLRIEQVQPDTPAAVAGLKSGDVIVSVNGQPITKPTDLTELTNANAGKTIDIEINRDGNIQTVSLIPRINFSSNQGRIGISFLTLPTIKKLPIYILIPIVIERSYAGYEELPISPFSLNDTYTTLDTSYKRLQSLFFGIILLTIGIGIWKLKKWSIYAYIIETVYEVIVYIPFALNPSNYSISPHSLSSNIPMIFYTLLFIGGIILEVLSAVYIYSKKSRFNL